MNKNKNKIKNILLIILILTVITAGIIYAKSAGILKLWTSMEVFQDYIKSFGAQSKIAYFLVQFISVIIAPIPSNISTAAGGVIFGMWESFFISTFAILSASILVFFLARKYGKPFVNRFVSHSMIEKYDKLIHTGRFEFVLLMLFLLPFFPDDVICFLAGLGVIKWGRFLAIMILTRPWGILAASAVGSSKIVVPWWGWALIILTVIPIYVYHEAIEEKLTKGIAILLSILEPN